MARVSTEDFFLRYGLCPEIATDQGTEFLNAVLSGDCDLLKVKHVTSSAYHHESIGSLENSHKMLGTYLYAADKPDTWDSWLRYYIFVYNTAVHSSTGTLHMSWCLAPSAEFLATCGPRRAALARVS